MKSTTTVTRGENTRLLSEVALELANVVWRINEVPGDGSIEISLRQLADLVSLAWVSNPSPEYVAERTPHMAVRYIRSETLRRLVASMTTPEARYAVETRPSGFQMRAMELAKESMEELEADSGPDCEE